jgi:predicted enzyme related to lactoylglutathione lyase
MSVKRLRQVFIAATDFDAQCTFYQRSLGLDLQFRDGDEWAQFKAGDVSFALAGERERMGAPPGSAVGVFEVANLDEFLAAVRSGGGEHGAVRDMGSHGKSALCRDPGGATFAALQKSTEPQK